LGRSAGAAAGWRAGAAGLERRREPADRTKATLPAQLERLWRREDVALREKALWRPLYEIAAHAGLRSQAGQPARKLHAIEKPAGAYPVGFVWG